jgi:hypothetical protein
MKALTLIDDSRAELISGGLLNTSFYSTTTGNGTAVQKNYIGNTGVALLGIGQFKLSV